MSQRNEYKKFIRFNGLELSKVIIDQHYKESHPEMNDELILELTGLLHNGVFPVYEEKDGFQYFVVQPLLHDDAPYRMVLTIFVGADFLGVINAFRLRRKK